jgi:hypothetical protein
LWIYVMQCMHFPSHQAIILLTSRGNGLTSRVNHDKTAYSCRSRE